MFTGGSACSGLYRGLRLWAAAVTEAGSLDSGRRRSRRWITPRSTRGRVAPQRWCPASITLRLNMYIAQARNGRFEIVETLGVIDPQEHLIDMAVVAG